MTRVLPTHCRKCKKPGLAFSATIPAEVVGTVTGNGIVSSFQLDETQEVLTRVMLEGGSTITYECINCEATWDE